MSDFLTRLGRADLNDDVALIATELVANAIMHARTEMSLSIDPTAAGVPVSVTDGCHRLPRWTPSAPMATSGRGLLLVERLSRHWGVEALPRGGKCVWAEVDAASLDPALYSADDLLQLWSDEPWPAHPVADAEVEVDVEFDVDVRAMLDSRAHTDEIVRDLQLTMLNDADAGTPTEATRAVIGLAQRLDSANNDFHEARRQMYNQTISADRHGHARTTLHLRLHRGDVALAQRWLEALNEADALTKTGVLLLPPFPPALTVFRRDYIAALVEQLDARR